MYFKRYRKRVGGRRVTYVSIAHNFVEHRKGKDPQTLPVVVLNFGRETREGREQREATLAMLEACYTQLRGAAK